MASFVYLRPDEIVTYPLPADDGSLTLGSVSSSNVDSDYTANSLIGGWPGTPTRWTVANPSGTITLPAAGDIDLVVVSHHKLVAGATVTCSNGISVVVTMPTVPPDGIRVNAFNTLTLATGVTAFDFTVAGNTGDAIIGEILAGTARTLTLPVWNSDDRGMTGYERAVDVDQASIAPYDRGLASDAPWKGKYILTQAQLNDVKDWYRAQRNGTRPSVVIPDTSVNEALVGFLLPPRWTPVSGRHFGVELTFTEERTPRSRW